MLPRVCLITCMLGLLFATGCQFEGDTESRLQLVDTYFERLTPDEKKCWLLSIEATELVATKCESPFRLVDTYLGYLTADEKTAWFASIKAKGMEATMRELPAPVSVFGERCNAYGIVTQKGLMSYDDHWKFCYSAGEVVTKLRLWARGLVLPHN